MSKRLRVSKAHPCPVCGKPDWCLVGDDSVICMRSPSGKQLQFSDGSAGWIHETGCKPSRIFVTKRQPAQKPVNLKSMMELWSRRTMPHHTASAARSLGVSVESLKHLGMAMRDESTSAFPMFNASRELLGIRLRSNNGAKFAVTGSRQGLFVPSCEAQKIVYLPEGPTSTAAALSLGVYAIGRPSCNGSIYEVASIVKRLGISRAVILGDADTDRSTPDGNVMNPGASGAMALAAHIGIPHCILILPCKDLREFVRAGHDRATLEYLVKQCVWKT